MLDRLQSALVNLAALYQNDEPFPPYLRIPGGQPLRVDGPFVDTPNHEDEFIRVDYELPRGVYAELEGDTYGSLTSFRIYKEKV